MFQKSQSGMFLARSLPLLRSASARSRRSHALLCGLFLWTIKKTAVYGFGLLRYLNCEQTAYFTFFFNLWLSDIIWFHEFNCDLLKILDLLYCIFTSKPTNGKISFAIKFPSSVSFLLHLCMTLFNFPISGRSPRALIATSDTATIFPRSLTSAEGEKCIRW